MFYLVLIHMTLNNDYTPKISESSTMTRGYDFIDTCSEVGIKNITRLNADIKANRGVADRYFEKWTFACVEY